MDIHREIADKYQGLSNLMSKEYNLILTISEMDEIIIEAQKVVNKISSKPVLGDSGRSEQLISFLEWRDKQNILTLHEYTNEELVRCYLKEINCH